jgi:hypothetical protein
MKRPNKLVTATVLSIFLGLTSVSCAVQGGSESGGAAPAAAAPSMPAAKLGLAPQLRPFHDELLEYGDWVLVEPLGWVFRPRVNTVAWRPYQDGHWIASFSYGWVWESNEDFGWITDHYGFWFYDEFQGWLWQPYGAWAPSWVAWVEVGDYVGWAPLPPDGAPDVGPVPGGMFSYASAHTLAGGGSSMRAGFVRELPDPNQDIRPIDRIASRGGVYWNAGPDPAQILGMASAEQLRLGERDGELPAPQAPVALSKEMPAFKLAQLEHRTTRAWSTARHELIAERARRAGATPGGTGGDSAPPPPPQRIKPSPTPADSTPSPAHADSVARAKRGIKPGVPRPPKS